MNNYIGHSLIKQRGGATLLFVMVILIIITVLGLSSARSALLQERMASISGGHNVAFQAAEAGLAEVEELIITTDPVEFVKNFRDPASGCQRGYCPLGRPTPEPPWLADTFWRDQRKIGQATALSIPPFGNISPRYIIEDLGQSRPDCVPGHIDITADVDCPILPGQRLYQITVYVEAAQGMSAMVQSQFFDPHPAIKR